MMSFDWIEDVFKMAQVMLTDGTDFAEAISDLFGVVSEDEKAADIGGMMTILAEGKFDDIVNG